MRLTVGSLVQDKKYPDVVYEVRYKSNWAHHIQSLDGVSNRSIRFGRLNRDFKPASDYMIKHYLETYLKRCLLANYAEGL